MAPTIVPDEYLQIHLAVCRARRQGLICSTCHELSQLARDRRPDPSATERVAA